MVRWGIKSCESATYWTQESTPAGSRIALAPAWINGQGCPPSRGELAGYHQEPHGSFLQCGQALPPAEEQTESPGSRHRHVKLQALSQGIDESLTERGRYELWEVYVPYPRRTSSPSTS